MKILFVSTYFVPYLSGLTVYPYRLLRHLAAKGSSIHVLTFAHTKNLPLREKKEGISIERVSYWFKISKGFCAPFFIVSVLRSLSSSDVMIINQPSVEGLIAIVLARLLGKSVISLYHCTLHLGDSLFHRILAWVVNKVIFIELILSHHIVATSEDYVRNTMTEKLHRKTTIIAPPIISYPTSEDVQTAFARQKGGNIWIGFCGRVAREKGIEYAVGASQYIHTPTVFVFAGPYGEDVVGEEEYYQKIKKLLITQNISHIFLGKLTDDQLGAFYCAIDVLAMCSINSTEAFGMVQAEAMLAGTPVVASDMPGVRVPISLAGMGYLFRPRDPQDLAEKLEKAIKNRKELSKKQNIAEKVFDIKKFYTKWEEVFEKV
ncbi:MAG TPA: glycosyltransferase family 4 protein [Patescibacteria group bacterium]|nr:glycosyltransferase family 4 protein [Patescibacteria group bacterium]